MDRHTVEQKTNFFVIKSAQRLDSTGWFGAGLFILSPIIAAPFYWGLINELAAPYDRSLWLPALGLSACSIAFLGGLVMVIVGREQRHVARELDYDPTHSRW